jgi:hypothetical protein
LSIAESSSDVGRLDEIGMPDCGCVGMAWETAMDAVDAGVTDAVRVRGGVRENLGIGRDDGGGATDVAVAANRAFVGEPVLLPDSCLDLAHGLACGLLCRELVAGGASAKKGSRGRDPTTGGVEERPTGCCGADVRRAGEETVSAKKGWRGGRRAGCVALCTSGCAYAGVAVECCCAVRWLAAEKCDGVHTVVPWRASMAGESGRRAGVGAWGLGWAAKEPEAQMQISSEQRNVAQSTRRKPAWRTRPVNRYFALRRHTMGYAPRRAGRALLGCLLQHRTCILTSPAPIQTPPTKRLERQRPQHWPPQEVVRGTIRKCAHASTSLLHA